MSDIRANTTKDVRRSRKQSDEGMALFTVVILGLVLSILGISLFAMATYEFNQATYRDQSGSAFWLADAAIEHGKAEVLKDVGWTAGFDSVSKGEGWYNLSISDTTFAGDSAKYWYSQGYVRRPGGGFVERDIEVFAKLEFAGFAYALFSMHDIECTGNASVCGRVHANIDVDNGGNCFRSQADTCAGGDDYISDDFQVLPPGMRTEPSFYPNTTYYYVVGHPRGSGKAIVLRATAVAATATHMIRGNSGNIPAVFVDSLTAVSATYSVAGNPPRPYVDYDFSNHAKIDALFNWVSGQCRLRDDLLDQDVVVNFGEYITVDPVIAPPLTPWRANLTFHDGSAIPILSSVFDTRYKGPDYEIRSLTDSLNWEGGNTLIRQTSFAPGNGIALLVHEIEMSGPALTTIGTPDTCAILYVTGSISGNLNANAVIYGSTIVLGTISQLNGGITFQFCDSYELNLPPYLRPFWQRPSGNVDVLLWREVPPKYRS